MHLPTCTAPLRRALVAAAVCLITPVVAFAGGMALTMQNGANLGNTFSGGAAAEDASTNYFNPAGLTVLQHPDVVVAANYLIATGGFTNNGSTTGGAFPTSGTDSNQAIKDTLVPSIYVAYPVSPTLAFGFGVGAPFGLATEYPAGWVGRYHALKSKLTTINLNPSVAWRPVQWLSLGVGLDREKADAELSNNVDFGLVGFANGVPGLLPGAADGFLRIKGDDATWGFNFGALVDLQPGSRVGLHYRSRMNHELHGRADFSGVPAPFAPVFASQDVSAGLNLPEIISLSYFHEISPTFALMADWSWWNWSRFETLAIDFANAVTPDLVLRQDWRDASIYSVGVRWRRSDNLTLRAGLAYNQTPVPSAARRTPRIPDSDRTWVGLGASWRVSDDVRFDLGYARLFMKKSTTTNDDTLGHVLNGNFDLGVHIVSAQFTWGY